MFVKKFEYKNLLAFTFNFCLQFSSNILVEMLFERMIMSTGTLKFNGLDFTDHFVDKVFIFL